MTGLPLPHRAPDGRLTQPRTATAATHPCAIHTYHAPAVVRTEWHHSKPQYLQIRLYGKVRYGPDTWCCSNDHDAIHEWIGWLLGESRKPDPEPGRLAKASAQASVDWYRPTQPKGAP